MARASFTTFVLAAALAFGAVSGTDGVSVLPADLFWSLRAPRLLLGLLSGAALASAGVASQALLQNPLADPYVLGVSGGAALGAVVLSVFIVDAPPWLLMAGAMAGAAVAAAFVFSQRARSSTAVTSLLLTGVVFNAFAAAVITLVKTLVSAQKAQEILYWLMGQLSVYDYSYITLLAVIVAAGLAAFLWQARPLDVLVQGDDVAQTLGVDPARVRTRVYVALSFLVGGVVAVTGLIGFVGLVIPHIVRARVGARHFSLFLLSAAWAGALVLVADAACRLLFLAFATELPVGVLTAFIGAPYFMWALRRTAIS